MGNKYPDRQNRSRDPADYDECVCHAPRVEVIHADDGTAIRYCEKCGGLNP
jgi:hypothetical protein